MPDERMSLADQIRHKLDVGLLPSVLPFKMWSGYGHNDPCNGCGQAIYPAQVKYEFKRTWTPTRCSGSTSAAWACGSRSYGAAASWSR
jgi:hypothetical protein